MANNVITIQHLVIATNTFTLYNTVICQLVESGWKCHILVYDVQMAVLQRHSNILMMSVSMRLYSKLLSFQCLFLVCLQVRWVLFVRIYHVKFAHRQIDKFIEKHKLHNININTIQSYILYLYLCRYVRYTVNIIIHGNCKL